MIIYELVGWTSAIDWGDRSERVHMGFFKTIDSARARKDAWQSEPNWRMEWERFDIVDHEVQE